MRFANNAHDTIQSPLAIHSSETPFSRDHSGRDPIIPIQLQQDAPRTQQPRQALLNSISHLPILLVRHTHRLLRAHHILRYRLYALFHPLPPRTAIRLLEGISLQRRRVVVRELTLADPRDRVEILVCGASSAVARVPRIVARCAVLLPEKPEEGALQSREVVDDRAAAPAVDNVDGVERALMLLDEDLDRGVVESEHAREIVHLGRGEVSRSGS